MKLSCLVAAIAKSLRASYSPATGDVLLVGLSGGADSTALLDALAWLGPRRGFKIVAAHLDHGLRAASGEEDAAACSLLCQTLGVKLRLGTADVRGRAQRNHLGLEDAARRERYAFLRQMMREEGATAMAVAHTRNDQAETVLLRLIRGAGSLGLGAMRPRAADVLRPMLEVSRQDVLRHLAARGLGWCEDASNHDRAFARNRVRHELLPALERENPRMAETLARTASLLADDADFVAAAGATLLSSVRRAEGSALLLDRVRLGAAPAAVGRAALRQAFVEMGQTGASALLVERVLGLARAPGSSGRRLALPGAGEATVSFSELRLGPASRPGQPFAFSLEVPGRVLLPSGLTLRAHSAAGPARGGGDRAVVAMTDEGEPLVVRTRRPGDRVLWHGRSQSLKRFLIDRRVPAEARGRLPLVASGRDVLFVPGLPVESPTGRRFVGLEVER